MPRIQLHFEHGDFKKAEDTIHHIVTKAVNESGGFNAAQFGAIANSMTRTLHRYIKHIQDMSGQPKYRFQASWKLITDGSKVQKGSIQKIKDGFNYTFGLSMVKYGWILGSDGFMLKKGAIPGLVDWIKAKMMKGVTFTYNEWVHVKGGRWKKSGKTKALSSERDFVALAAQIVNGMKRDHKMSKTIVRWYKTALMPYSSGKGNIYFERDVMEHIVKSKNLIPAVKKDIIDNINKKTK